MRIVTRGLGGAAYQGIITSGLGPLILEVVRIIRGGRSVVRDIYGDKIEDFLIAVQLMEINGKDLIKPILNRRRYRLNDDHKTKVNVTSRSIKRRKNNIFKVLAETIKIKRGSDGKD